MDQGCTCFWLSCPTNVGLHTSLRFQKRLQFLSDSSSPWSQGSVNRRLSPHIRPFTRSSPLCAVNCPTNCSPIDVSTPWLIFRQLFHSIYNSCLDCQVDEIWKQLGARPMHRSVRTLTRGSTLSQSAWSFSSILRVWRKLPAVCMSVFTSCWCVYLCCCCCHQTTVSWGSSIDWKTGNCSCHLPGVKHHIGMAEISRSVY